MASQSVSRVQAAHASVFGSPQKEALPVVSRQMPPVPHVASTPLQASSPGWQTPVLWATHRDLSFFPFFGFLPLQMPEQQLALLPRQGLPTSTQP